jgi:predicted DNA-binding transcriptional regulator AlpA
MPFANPNITESSQPLLIDAKTVARMLGRCERSLWRDDEVGRIPRPVEIGGSKRWRLEELCQWVRAGCPPREVWESRRNESP